MEFMICLGVCILFLLSMICFAYGAFTSYRKAERVGLYAFIAVGVLAYTLNLSEPIAARPYLFGVAFLIILACFSVYAYFKYSVSKLN